MKADFTVTYFLWTARKGKDGLAPVYLSSKQNSKKLIRYNTGVRIHPSAWSKARKEPKSKPAALLELEGRLKKAYRELREQGMAPSLSDLLKYSGTTRPTGQVISEWCDDYQKGSYSGAMKHDVRSLKSCLDQFRPGLTFQQLNRQTLRAMFEDFTARGMANNSQAKRLSSLRNVADHAEADCPDLAKFELPYRSGDAFQVRLTWQEVQAIEKVEPVSKVETAAKLVFMLACFSGLRISDLLTIRKGTLHATYYERLQTKTKRPVYVTVHARNEKLFRQLYSHPVTYVRQGLSEALKDLMQRAECPSLMAPATKLQHVGHEHREVTKPKYAWLSFHSARRFYARLLADLGLDDEIKRDELGHTYGNITALYAGSPTHALRIARVCKAMDGMEERLKELEALKV